MQPVDPYSSTSKQIRTWVLVGVALVVVGVIGYGTGSGLFGFSRQNPSGALEQQGGMSRALEKAAEAAPVLEKPAEQAPILPDQQLKMPDDVLAWLKHLEETERRRKELSGQQVAAITVQMTYMSLGAGKDAIQGLLGGDLEALEQPPTKEVSDNAEQYRGRWQELIAFFKSVTPPAECVVAFSSYSETLGETSVMLNEITTAITQASTDPEGAIQALNGMKGDSTSRIGAPAGETDKQVQAICDRYATRKWFSIARDFGGGSLGIPGR